MDALAYDLPGRILEKKLDGSSCPSYFSSLNNDVVSVLDPCYKAKTDCKSCQSFY